MPRARSSAGEEIPAFLHDVNEATAKNSGFLADLVSLRSAAETRMAGLQDGLSSAAEPSAIADVAGRLLAEIAVRDEELRATADELALQLEAARKAAQLLDRERAKYLDLFHHAPDAYFLTNLDGAIEEANVEAGALLRADERSLRGRLLITFVARQDTQAFRALLLSLRSHRRRVPVKALLRVRPRGHSVFTVIARVGIVASARGQAIALRWSLRPLDSEGQSGIDGRMLVELATTLVEEMRAPLAPILGWAGDLLDGAVNDDEKRQALRWIQNGGRASLAKLEELEEFADVHRSPGDSSVCDAVAATKRAVQADPEVSRVVFRCYVSADEVAIFASELERALGLFLRRALEGTPGDGAVEVDLWADADEVVVDIVAPEEARQPGGWSLRTATAARIVERAGGRVTLEDRSPSVRARFLRVVD